MSVNSTTLVAPSDLVVVDQLNLLSPDQLNELPIGVIELDDNGVVCFYNSTEARMSGRKPHQVVGKNFFSEIAPCTNIPQFRGRYFAGVKKGDLHEKFIFNFDFEMTPPVKVLVELLNGRMPGKYWLLTNVIDSYETRQPSVTVKDIVYAKTSGKEAEEFCAQEPIHRPDSIQSWGALVIADTKSGRVVAKSDNLWEVLATADAEEVLDADLDTVFHPEEVRLLAELSAKSDEDKPKTAHKLTTLKISKEKNDLRFVAKGRYIFVEISVAEQSVTVDILPREILDFCTELSSCNEVEELCDSLVDLLQEITDFERVVAYKFAPSWEGQTIAEAMRADSKLDSFRGLYFPASDIPPQARAMHSRIHTSFTPGRDYVPVGVEFSSTSQPTAHNLEGVHLRSVSPVRSVYHKTIGVNGSATCSLRVNGRLWGLVILHDSLPKYLNFSQKVALATLSQVASSRLETLVETEKASLQQDARKVLEVILNRVAAADDLYEATIGDKSNSVLDVFDCSGAAIWIDGHWRTIGKTPPEELIHDLVSHIVSDPQCTIWKHECLSEVLASFQEEAEFASGALFATPIAGDNRNSIIWFFPERVIKKDWAGNPTEKLHFTQTNNGEMVLPRLSFAKWSEFTSSRSMPLEEHMEEIAEDLRVALGGFLARRSRQLAELTVELRDQNAFLNAILESLTSAIFTFKADGEILSANKVACELFGAAESELVGHNFRNLFAAEATPELAAARGDLDSGKIVRAKFQRRNGKTFSGALATGNWVRSAVQMRVASIRDVSDLELFEQNANRQSKLEAIGQIASSIAHDYNNFLAIISGNLELISMFSKDEKVASRVDPALHAVKRAGGLTERLLSLVRDRAPTPLPTDLSMTISNCRDLLKSTLGVEIDLSISLPEALPQILAEQGQIENALVNLLNNSRDALNGKGKVQIEVRPSQPEAKWLPLRVRDNGTGMDASVLAKASEPFFTTKSPGAGTGLGLSAVGQDLESIGGKLEVKSVLGVGTEVTLHFPIAEQSDTRGSKQQASNLDASHLKNKKLLFVDDEVATHETMAALFRGFGASVGIAASVQEAKLLARPPSKYDVIVSDVNLKEGPVGFDLVKELLAIHPSAVGMCVSGSDCSRIPENARNGIQLLRKPFSVADFTRILERINPTEPDAEA